MPKRVELPDGGIGEFPDSMSDAQIEEVLRKEYAPKAQPSAPAQPVQQKPATQSIIGAAIEGINRRVVDEASKFARGAASALNPMEVLRSGARLVADPVGTVSGMLDAQGNVLRTGVEELGRGNIIRGGRKIVAGMIPLVGPAIDAMGDKAESGQLSEALGEAAGTAVSTFIPTRLPKSVKVVKPGASNPQQSAMMQFAQQRNIPLSVADVSDNAFARGAQQVGSSTILGGPIAAAARERQVGALRRVAGELMEETYGGSMTPETAGRSVKEALGSKAQQFAEESRKGYGKLESAAESPRNVKEVPIRTETVPTGVMDAAGNPVMKTREVTESMAFPVDMRGMKDYARPILEDLRKRMKPADPEAAKVLRGQIESLQSIVDGADFKPARIAEEDLGAIKALRRNATNESALTMRGAQQIDALQASIERAVKSDPKALLGLEEGRANWARKSQIEEIAAKLHDEPVSAFGQTTWAKDSGADFLRNLAAEAPQEMPKIGRAWLEKTFEKAMSEGGFTGGRGLKSQWDQLGPETKKILFKDPALRKNLDDFFRLSKRIDSPINTSGTAPTAMAGRAYDLAGMAMTGSGQFFSALASQAGAAGITALMYDPRFVAAMNRGLSVPIGSPAQAAAVAQMVRIAESNGMIQSPQTELQPAAQGLQ